MMSIVINYSLWLALSHNVPRWLYWTDRSKGLEIVAATGEGRQTLLTGLMCPWPITIDYISHTLYWSDICRLRIETANVDGTERSIFSPLSHRVLFSYGLTIFGDYIYWAQSNTREVFKADKREATQILKIYTHTVGGVPGRPNTVPILNAIQVVHPSRQLQG